MFLRIKHTKEELKGVSDHLFYEFLMFINMAEEMQSGKYIQGTTVMNALLEAFTIHARILLDFLYKTKDRVDDVVAGDFFADEGIWLRIRPKMPPNLENLSKRVGKEIAHLTFSRLRVTPENKPWTFVDIARDMIGVFDKFLENVSKDNMHISWNQYYSIRNRYFL